MKNILLSLTLATAFMMSASLAHAASQDGTPPPSAGGPREACRADAMTFCRDVQPGGGRIRDCLEDHYKEISDACYTALKNAPPPPPQNDDTAPPKE